MEKGKVIKPTNSQAQSNELDLTVAETKHLADFFAVLIQIDRRLNITKTYGNKQPNK